MCNKGVEPRKLGNSERAPNPPGSLVIRLMALCRRNAARRDADARRRLFSASPAAAARISRNNMRVRLQRFKTDGLPNITSSKMYGCGPIFSAVLYAHQYK